MIELTFTICLLASPHACEERSLLFSDVSAERCIQGAQPQLAKWAMEHQGWRIARWSCRKPGLAGREA